MDLSAHTYADVITFLDKEGYIGNNVTYVDETGPYVVICLNESQYYNNSDDDDIAVKDSGYTICKHITHSNLMSYVGCIHCGGEYTAIGIFYNNENITKKFVVNMKYFAPKNNKHVQKNRDNDSNDSNDSDN